MAKPIGAKKLHRHSDEFKTSPHRLHSAIDYHTPEGYEKVGL